MKITVQVKTRSKIEGVSLLEGKSYLVRVRELPVEGRANERIVELLSKHFKKPKSGFQLLSGHRGKIKIFSISS